MDGTMIDLYGLTVSELDDLLDELDLDASGLKADKLQRLEEYYTETPKAGAETPEVTNRREVIESLVPFTIRMWSGIKPVYVCTKCDRQMDDEDDALMHYIMHFPHDKRESILEQIVGGTNE
jgi:hypothetical protein